jgi:hypothetical protein
MSISHVLRTNRYSTVAQIVLNSTHFYFNNNLEKNETTRNIRFCKVCNKRMSSSVERSVAVSEQSRVKCH